MADLTELTTRSAGFLTGQKWEVVEYKDYRHGALGYDLQVLTRRLRGVPVSLLDGALAHLAAQASFLNPVPEGKKLAGTWYGGHVWWDEVQAQPGESSLSIVQVLVRGAVITSEDTTAFSFTIPSAGGASTVSIINSRNKATLQAILTALPATTNNSAAPSYDPVTGLFSVTIHSAVDSRKANYEKYGSRGPLYEAVEDFRWDREGHYIREVWLIQCWFMDGTGVYEDATGAYTGGLIRYHTGSGIGADDALNMGGAPLEKWSWFHRKGDDQFSFKRVTKSYLLTEDKTSAYNYDNRNKSAKVGDSKVDGKTPTT